MAFSFNPVFNKYCAPKKKQPKTKKNLEYTMRKKDPLATSLT